MLHESRYGWSFSSISICKFCPLTLFRMGVEGEAKRPSYQFFPCNIYKRRNQPLKLSRFKFWPFCHTAVKSLTSLIEMLELPNLFTWPHLQYNLSHMKESCWWRHSQELWHNNLFFKTRRRRVANFAEIIKNLTTFSKVTFKDSKKC